MSGYSSRSVSVGQDLLDPQAPLLVPRPRQAERLVPGGKLDRAGARVAAERHRERLEHDPRHVVLGLGLGQAERVDLDAVAHAQQLRVLDAVALAPELLPEDAHRAQLRVLLDEADAGVDEEADPAEDPGEVLLGDLPALADGVEHGDRVGDREGDLLDRRRPRLLQVVGADVDRVPARDLVDREGDHVGDQPHRRLRREGVGAPREVLLDDVVLGRALERGALDALLVGDGDVEAEEPRRGRVDRHRGVHLAERDAVDERLHVAAVDDRDADLADLAAREHGVGVVAGLRRQVEGDREAGLPLRQVPAVELVGAAGVGVAGVGPHHPGPVAIGQAVVAVDWHARDSPMTRAIDTMHLGLDRVIAVWERDGVIVDPGPREHDRDGARGPRPRARGGPAHPHPPRPCGRHGDAGRALPRDPGLRPRGRRPAPDRPLEAARAPPRGSTATRWTGSGARRWPVPEANVTALSGGERVEGLDVLYAPGHASHHVVYVDPDGGEAFCGDVGGRADPAGRPRCSRRRRRRTSTSSSGRPRSTRSRSARPSACCSRTSARSRTRPSTSTRCGAELRPLGGGGASGGEDGLPRRPRRADRPGEPARWRSGSARRRRPNRSGSASSATGANAIPESATRTRVSGCWLRSQRVPSATG